MYFFTDTNSAFKRLSKEVKDLTKYRYYCRNAWITWIQNTTMEFLQIFSYNVNVPDKRVRGGTQNNNDPTFT